MSDAIPVWIVEDEPGLRTVLAQLLARPGHAPRAFPSGEAALAALPGEGGPIVVLSDLALSSGMTGLQLLEKLKAAGRPFEFILMTAYASAESALGALRLGAFDYVIKPFKNDELLNVVAQAAEKLRLALENRQLRSRLDALSPGEELVGQAPSFQAMLALIESLGSATSSVLITGESGTGKELAARALHRRAFPPGAPFVSVNCGALPESLLESELFGWEKGAFTGAAAARRGLIEAAAGGTLFLDEIGEMPPAMQVKLLRVLQDRKVRPLGATQERPAEFRLVCATHRDLKAMAREGKFRDDLYYRINVIHLAAPPLRERREDVPLLAHHFLRKFTRGEAGRAQGFTAAALAALGAHPWPGNVRELENVVERAAVLCRDPLIDASHLALDAAPVPAGAPAAEGDPLRLPEAGLDLEATLDRFRAGFLRQAMDAAGGGQGRAAELLRISTRSLRYYLKKHPVAPGE